MKTRRLDDVVKRMAYIGASLEELEDVLSARRAPDRSPLQAYIDDEMELPVGAIRPALSRISSAASAASSPSAQLRRVAKSPARSGHTRVVRRIGTTVRVGALPVFLAAALSLFGLVRLQPANTLWSQELTLTSNVETGQFGCEPLKLAFAGLTHPESGKTTLTYALSSGGTQGFGCPAKDISHIAIPVGTCFNPEVQTEGPLVGETHPGTGTTAWKYSAKNSSTPKLVKWDSKTDDAPLGGRGPFDPGVMKFSITFDRTLNPGDLESAMAYYKAGQETPDLGEVSVPKCPLPASLAPLSLDEPGPVITAAEEPSAEEPEAKEAPAKDVEEEPEDDARPVKPGPVMPGEGRKPPKATPTPTPKPIGIAIYGGGR